MGGQWGEKQTLGGGIKNCALLMCLRCLLGIGVMMLGGRLKITVWRAGEGAGAEIKFGHHQYVDITVKATEGVLFTLTLQLVLTPGFPSAP